MVAITGYGVFGAVNLLYVYSPKLIPVNRRSTEMGYLMSMYRVGGLLAPTAMYYVRNNYCLLSFSYFISFICVIFLPQIEDEKLKNFSKSLAVN